MRRAIQLARKGEGRVEPNPMVGCVIARGGRIIGEGYHRRFGGPHAEIEALRSCPSRVRGATVYVSLEPCCHFGKTPPCTNALIEAGVGRVVAAIKDPNPLVCGQGLRQLRKAGITVETGLLTNEAAEVLAPYLTRVRLRRPYVIAKWAQSLDGKLATAAGESKWITGEAARREAHQLRARVDAILVGSGTVIADDPLLTARGVPIRRVATRVVMDRRLRIPIGARLVQSALEFPTILFTSALRSNGKKARQLAGLGVQVVGVAAETAAGFIEGCLNELANREVTNLLVEGGPKVLTAFFEAGLVDEAWVFTAPMFIGGTNAPSALDASYVSKLTQATRPVLLSTRRIGTDTLHRMQITPPAIGRGSKK